LTDTSLLNREKLLIQIDTNVYIDKTLSRTTAAILAIFCHYADSDIDEVCTH